ncbi:MAG: energy coupling factor transporter S component ThiW [Candidatus Bathyarchaeia archaeon]
MNGKKLTLKLALTGCFTALGVVIAPLFHFLFLGTKAFPGQHFINALTGVIIGPFWGSLTAILIGIIRNLLGLGTVFAFPGGIPGALIVGLAYKLTKKLKKKHFRYAAVFLEPLGTVIIGATISLFVIAPIIGWRPLLNLVEKTGWLPTLLTLWFGWSISSIIGSVTGYFTLLILDKSRILEKLKLEE